MQPTLTTNVSIEEVIDALAYLHAKHPIPETALEEAIDMVLSGHGDWNTYQVVEQITYRAEVISGHSDDISRLRDVTEHIPVEKGSWRKRLESANVIKQVLRNDRYGVTEPVVDLSEIPF